MRFSFPGVAAAAVLSLIASAAMAAQNPSAQNPSAQNPSDRNSAEPQLTLERLFADPPLGGTPPRALSVSPDGRTLAWLKPRADDRLRYDLWVEDVASGRRRMLVDSLRLSSGTAQLSEAELMRRERERLGSSRGIIEFRWSPDGRALVVPLDGDLWLAPLDGAARRLTATADTEIDPRISPGARWLSFVRGQDLMALDLKDGVERTLAHGGGTVSYGVAEFVAQEEMDRKTGQWWSPDDRRIAVARVDEADVKLAVRAAIGADGTRMVEQRYPSAGTPNARVTLEIHDMTGGDPVQVDLGHDPDIYLARVDWLNASQLLVQRQSRDQKRLDVLLVDAATGKSRSVLAEKWDSWVDLTNSLRPLRDGRRFVWSSARSGQRHLYLVDDGRLSPITHGDWSVDELVAVNEKRGVLLFTGYKDGVLEKSLYEARLDGRGDAVRLTAPGGWSEAVSDGKGDHLLITRSDPETPPTISLAQVGDSGLRTLRRISEPGIPYDAFRAGHVTPRFGTVKAADGVTDLNYEIFVPKNLRAGTKAPVFFEVYGGPTSQRVKRGWDSLIHQYLLRQGWIIFMADNRGTPNRGRAFADPIYKRAGFPEVDDQMAALAWLKQQPEVDADRIAVYGWSYGGYMVQRLLTKHPGAFAAGVSGAPVTDWKLYDTHYTERYLGNPATDPAPYEASDVTRDAARLSDPLLIVHGLSDDNVVFDHSARMMAALQQAGKPFEAMVYPGQTHAINQPALQRHLWMTVLSFLDRTVRDKPAPSSRP